MIGVELIAETVEEPFGTDEDDLPLDTLCKGIEVSLREIAERTGELADDIVPPAPTT
ncbi:MAG: hypothetical protein KF708_19605 [Pirellulales bacterium]|nr:hypothetical protein [Pirellulales bacterium]